MKVKRKNKEECNFSDLPYNCKFIHDNMIYFKIYKTDSCAGDSALRYSDGMVRFFKGDEKCERIEGELVPTDEVVSFRDLEVGECFKYSPTSSSVLMKVYRDKTLPKKRGKHVLISASAIDLITACFIDTNPSREVVRWHGEFVQQ